MHAEEKGWVEAEPLGSSQGRPPGLPSNARAPPAAAGAALWLQRQHCTDGQHHPRPSPAAPTVTSQTAMRPASPTQYHRAPPAPSPSRVLAPNRVSCLSDTTASTSSSQKVESSLTPFLPSPGKQITHTLPIIIPLKEETHQTCFSFSLQAH